MAEISPTKFSSHGIFPTFQSGDVGGDTVTVPGEASTIILIVTFGGDDVFEVVSHATSAETEAGTTSSNESFDGTSGDLAVLEIDLGQDDHLVSSSKTIDLEWNGNSGNFNLAAIYRA